MVLISSSIADLNKLNNIEETGNVPSSDNASQTIDVKQSEINDEYKFNNNQVEDNTISNQQVKDIFYPLLIKNGVSTSDADKIISAITSGIEINQSTLNSIRDCLNATINALKKYNKPLDAESIISYTKSIKIMTDNNWTLDGAIKDKFTNNSQETIADKLKRYYPNIFTNNYNFNDPANYDQIKEYAAKYIGSNLNQNENIGITDVAKMLTNCKTDEERAFFEKIIKEISDTDERLNFLKSYIYSFESDEARTQASNNLYADIETTRGMAPEHRRQANQLIISHVDNDGFKNGYDARQQRVKEIQQQYDIEAIKNKPEEERTPEESEALKEWELLVINDSSDAQIGLANNKVMDESQRDENLALVDNTLREYGDDVYRSVYQMTIDYIENHPESLNLSKEDFVELMDKVTNGNFSIIANDTKKGTTTQLNGPADLKTNNTESKGSAYNTTTGMLVVDKNISVEEKLKNIEAKKNSLNSKSEIKTTKNTRANYGTVDLYLTSENTTTEDVDNYIKEGGVAAITDILNSKSKCKLQKYAYNKALQIYELSLNSTSQERTISNTIKSSSLTDLFKRTKNISVIEGISHFTSFFAKQIAEKRVEDLEKQA